MVEQPPPKPRSSTARDALRAALRHGPRTARELSVEVSLSERDVVHHLGHLELSIERDGEYLDVEPARCIACGYPFEDRTRLTKPGRCPHCKSTRIAVPRFQILSG